ncbi:ste11-like protein [Mycena galericulata]|nr:ste11-like protein [Mycena galericulata]
MALAASYRDFQPGTPVSPSSRSFAIRGHSSPFPSTPTTAMNPFFDPPPNTSYADFIRTWTDQHVARWLTDIKCANHAATFRANDIRGDILLELDQTTLQEMGVSSIGDRLRIINAVKSLRQRSAARVDSVRPSRLALDVSPDVTAIKQEASPTTRLGSRRLDNNRPTPLQLNPSQGRNDLPRLVREQPPDSARLNGTNNTHAIRPLPQPTQQAQQSSSSSSSSLPPANPPAQPHQVAGHPTFHSPPAPEKQLLTPSSASNWTGGYGLPNNPRPSNDTKTPRSTSPLNFPNKRIPHGRNSSLGNNSPGTSSSPSPKPIRANTGPHPYATTQASALANNLSPIDESFNQVNGSGTPSPPSFVVGRGPFNNPTTPSPGSSTPSLDDLRRKLFRFLLPEDGLTFTVDIGSCVGGIEVLEKVLKKFGKGGNRLPSTEPDAQITSEGGLSVEGWGVYLDMGQEDGPGEPLSEAELLSVCHAPPNHPVREHGLTLRRTGISPRADPPPREKFLGATTKATRRASSISILSGLGVDDPERALLDPSSPPAGRRASPTPSGPPTPPLASGRKRPSKLHNFFGQRPPSELITDHLTEYFPLTDKKVLRTARQSMIFRAGGRGKRDSTASWGGAGAPALPSSRFSSSTQGSANRASMSSPRTSFSSQVPPPPLPDRAAAQTEDIPRVSLSTDDGRSVDLHDGGQAEAPVLSAHPQLLPPIPFPTESLSESLEGLTGPGGRRLSRNLSAASSTRSNRMSYMTELRSKRDRTDTASMLTMDEITADLATGTGAAEDGWEKVEPEGEGEESTLNDEDAVDELEDEDDDDDELVGDDEEATLNNPDGNDEDEESKGETQEATKWIKGALIGAGSFGKVYLGMDASTGLLMAVKQVELPTGSAPNQERKKSMLSALEREIELLKDLQHENIVQYLYSSLDDEFLNIFLEYVPGGSVTALLRNYGAFEEPLVKNFVRQILEGLNYLHERDIIHRDIKGANILVDNKGGIKISDFGISKKVEDNLLTGNRMHRPSLQGSVFWMAPEVVKQSGHTRKADIWSVGCLVVEMLTGEHPWATLTQMQAIFKIGSSAKPTIPSDISSDAQDFLLRTFELNQDARPSAAELLQHAWVGKKPAGNGPKKATTMVSAS